MCGLLCRLAGTALQESLAENAVHELGLERLVGRARRKSATERNPDGTTTAPPAADEATRLIVALPPGRVSSSRENPTLSDTPSLVAQCPQLPTGRALLTALMLTNGPVTPRIGREFSSNAPT